MKPKMARGSGQQTAHPDGSLGRKYECCQTTNKEEGVLLWMQEHAIGQAEHLVFIDRGTRLFLRRGKNLLGHFETGNGKMNRQGKCLNSLSSCLAGKGPCE